MLNLLICLVKPTKQEKAYMKLSYTHTVSALSCLTYNLSILPQQHCCSNWIHVTQPDTSPTALCISHFLAQGFFCHIHEKFQQEPNQPFWYMSKLGTVRELTSHGTPLTMRDGNQWISTPLFSEDSPTWFLAGIDWIPISQSKNQFTNAAWYWLSLPSCFTFLSFLLLEIIS